MATRMPRKALVIVLLVVPMLLSVTSSVATPTPMPANVTVHVVQLGETLHGIALFYGVSIPVIAQANNLVSPDLIYPGQRLIIPGVSRFEPAAVTVGVATQVYTVQPGDTLSELALRFGTSVSAIAMANNISNPDLILVGQRLVLPGTVVTRSAMGLSAGVPGPQALRPAVCNPSVGITFPRQGEVLNGVGTYNITGTASIEDFQFYKLELGVGETPIEFHSIDEIKTKPVVNGILLRDWNTGALPEGTYTLRLTVVDNRGQFPRPCDVVIRVDHGTAAGPATRLSMVSTVPGPGLKTALVAPRPALLRPAVCNESVRITFPRQGEVLNGVGTYNVMGTASIKDFQFYKLELGMGEAPIAFHSIDEIRTKPVVNGILLRDWNTGALPEGTYTLRLTAVNNRGQFPRPCDVLIHVDR